MHSFMPVIQLFGLLLVFNHYKLHASDIQGENQVPQDLLRSADFGSSWWKLGHTSVPFLDQTPWLHVLCTFVHARLSLHAQIEQTPITRCQWFYFNPQLMQIVRACMCECCSPLFVMQVDLLSFFCLSTGQWCHHAVKEGGGGGCLSSSLLALPD